MASSVHRSTTVELRTVGSHQPSGYCFTVFALLKWAEIICGIIVFALSDWGMVLQVTDMFESIGYDFKGYYFILVISMIILLVTFVFLMLYVCRHQHAHLLGCPWSKIEIVFNGLAAVCYFVVLILAALEANEIYKYSNGQIISGTAGINYIIKRWVGHVVAVAVFAGINMVLYIATAVYASRLIF